MVTMENLGAVTLIVDVGVGPFTMLVEVVVGTTSCGTEWD